MRIATWIGSAVIGYFAAGVVSLLAVAYLASALAPSLTAREYVLAAQTFVWLILSAGVASLAGQALFGRLDWPTPLALLVGMTVPVLTSFAIAADARMRSGTLDIDQVGIAVLVPGALVAGTVSFWNTSAASSGSKSWAGLTLLAALAVIVTGAGALIGTNRQGPIALLALVVAIGIGVFLAVRALNQIRSRTTRPTTTPDGD